MSVERWKQIRNFSMYEVSDAGRIRSNLMGYSHLLKPAYRNGYAFVTLHNERKPHAENIHVLVLEAFIGPRPKDLVSNHKDGVKRNNKLTNLEWTTQSKNVKHAYKMGLLKAPGWRCSGPGERNPHHKLKNGEVWLIKKLLWYKCLHKEIAKMFRVSRSTISQMNRGFTGKHIKFEPKNF